MGQEEEVDVDDTSRDVASVKEVISRFQLVTKNLCEFHVKKAWKEGLQRHVKEKEKQNGMYFGLERIMREGITCAKAQTMIQSICST